LNSSSPTSIAPWAKPFRWTMEAKPLTS
jgi:hypothetical protein